ATLIRQTVAPGAWLALQADSDSLVAIEGGTALSDVPVVAHAISTLRHLCGFPADFAQISEWLRAPYWDTPSAGQRARLDLWLRESGGLSVRGSEWVALLKSAPAPVVAAGGALQLARRFASGLEALGAGVVSPREWSERFRAALEVVGWPGERVRSS